MYKPTAPHLIHARECPDFDLDVILRKQTTTLVYCLFTIHGMQNNITHAKRRFRITDTGLTAPQASYRSLLSLMKS